MRITAVTTFPPTVAGIADYGAHVLEQVARDVRVSRVTVLADRGGAAGATDPALDVRRVWRRDDPRLLFTLLREIEASRPDVVWSNVGLTMFGTGPFAASAMLAPILARAMGYPVVATLHEIPALADLEGLGIGRARARIAGSLLVRLVLGATSVAVTLERHRAYLAERGARHVTHIAHGSWDECERRPEPAVETVLVLGTFGPHKDPGIVAEAVRLVRRSRPALRLVIAGADHPRYPGFMDACRERYDLDGEWIGYVPRERLSALFADSTVVVLPTLASSGSSGVVHRAAAHGRAVIASDLPDLRALANELDLDLAWTRPGDVADLARVLDELLGDGSRRSALVARGLRSLARVSPARTADAYVSLFASASRVGERVSRPIEGVASA